MDGAEASDDSTSSGEDSDFGAVQTRVRREHDLALLASSVEPKKDLDDRKEDVEAKLPSKSAVDVCFTPEESEAGAHSKCSSRSSDLAAELLLGSRDDAADRTTSRGSRQRSLSPDSETLPVATPRPARLAAPPATTALTAVLGQSHTRAGHARPGQAAPVAATSSRLPVPPRPMALAELPTVPGAGAGGHAGGDEFELLVDEDDVDESDTAGGRSAAATLLQQPKSHAVESVLAPAPAPAQGKGGVTAVAPVRAVQSGPVVAQKVNLLEAMGCAVASVEAELKQHPRDEAPAMEEPKKLSATPAKPPNAALPPPAAASAPTVVTTSPLREIAVPSGARLKLTRSAELAPVSLGEVKQWIFGLAIDPEVLLPLHEEMTNDAAKCCMGRRRPRSEVPGLERMLWKDKDFVLFLRMTPFDFHSTMHARILTRLYCGLTNQSSCFAGPGTHWQKLGFQNQDPAIVLNDTCGVLALLHLFLFFASNVELCKYAFILSSDHQNSFPFSDVSVAITNLVVESLLAGKLSWICNASGRGVFDCTCEIYVAALMHFCSCWRKRRSKRTDEDHQQVLKVVRAALNGKPAKLVGELTSLSDYNASVE